MNWFIGTSPLLRSIWLVSSLQLFQIMLQWTFLLNRSLHICKLNLRCEITKSKHVCIFNSDFVKLSSKKVAQIYTLLSGKWNVLVLYITFLIFANVIDEKQYLTFLILSDSEHLCKYLSVNYLLMSFVFFYWESLKILSNSKIS